jgi:pyrroloquinoline quinone biosynthesis protein E
VDYVDALRVSPPASLLAELTHRCPLHCAYCSNPRALVARRAELPTNVWLRVFEEAADLGVLQMHFSGGEPLLRPDLVPLVRRATRLGLYGNLITSGVGLSRSRAEALREAGLGAVQLSVQAADPTLNRTIAGGEFWERKAAAARYVREAGMPLSVNVVLHRQNLHQVTELLELARAWGAGRVELANAQYYGWALLNRPQLLPTRGALDAARAAVARFRERVGAAMEIVWVVPDYYAEFPKPCMNGWGSRFLTVAPDGTALPCPAASVIPRLGAPSVHQRTLRWCWYESPAFNRFRGVDWMGEPCRTCSRRFKDFGGCRCQAYLLTGNAAATDPVCVYSPHRAIVAAATADATPALAAEFAPMYRQHSEETRMAVLQHVAHSRDPIRQTEG